MNLTVTLANTDFKLTYFGSALGYLWTLMRPLLFFGVLLVVFTKIFHVGEHIPHYPVTLLGAIIFWTFFVQVTTACVQCLLAREGLLRKMRFPRLVIPLAVGADRALPAGAEHGPGVPLRDRLRRLPAPELARAAGADRAARDARASASA